MENFAIPFTLLSLAFSHVKKQGRLPSQFPGAHSFPWDRAIPALSYSSPCLHSLKFVGAFICCAFVLHYIAKALTCYTFCLANIFGREYKMAGRIPKCMAYFQRRHTNLTACAMRAYSRCPDAAIQDTHKNQL